MGTENTPHRHPMAWVPTLFYAEGLPYHVVGIMIVLMYKSMHVPNEQIARWTGILMLAWVFKSLWSPFLELAPSKKSMVVLFQLIGGTSMGIVALTLQLPDYFAASVAVLALVAIASATHDIVADGLYIASLSTREQAAYSGWISAFNNIARIFGVGGLVVLAGYFEQRMEIAHAWSIIFGILGTTMVLLGLYHSWALPGTRNIAQVDTSIRGVFTTLKDVILDFFRKPGIWLAILFIFLYMAGYGQISTIGQLFLRDTRAVGGIGLSTEQTGVIYTSAGAVAGILGAIAGGYFTSWLGLRRAMVFLIIMMNLPNIAFYFLSASMPTSLTVITSAICVENFGVGFGWTGLTMFMMQVVSVGKYQTAHYAMCTGIMALGISLFKMISGDIQVALGYQHFFLWVLISAIPVLLLSFRIVPVDSGAQQVPAETVPQPYEM